MCKSIRLVTEAKYFDLFVLFSFLKQLNVSFTLCLVEWRGGEEERRKKRRRKWEYCVWFVRRKRREKESSCGFYVHKKSWYFSLLWYFTLCPNETKSGCKFMTKNVIWHTIKKYKKWCMTWNSCFSQFPPKFEWKGKFEKLVGPGKALPSPHPLSHLFPFNQTTENTLVFYFSVQWWEEGKREETRGEGNESIVFGL